LIHLDGGPRSDAARHYARALAVSAATPTVARLTYDRHQSLPSAGNTLSRTLFRVTGASKEPASKWRGRSQPLFLAPSAS
jgi:hypothetical protein